MYKYACMYVCMFGVVSVGSGRRALQWGAASLLLAACQAQPRKQRLLPLLIQAAFGEQFAPELMNAIPVCMHRLIRDS